MKYKYFLIPNYINDTREKVPLNEVRKLFQAINHAINAYE
jgi:hypothetical protein